LGGDFLMVDWGRLSTRGGENILSLQLEYSLRGGENILAEGREYSLAPETF